MNPLPTFQGFSNPSLAASLLSGASIGNGTDVAKASAMAPGQTVVNAGGLVTSPQNTVLGNTITPVTVPGARNMTPFLGPAQQTVTSPSQNTYAGLNADQLLAQAKGLLSPTGTSNSSFSVPDKSTYPSSALAPINVNDVLNQHQNGMNSLLGGDGTKVASDNLLKDLYGQIYNSSVYTPEEKSYLQQIADANSQISSAKLAEQKQVYQLMQNGQITQDQAGPMVADTQRRANENLAMLGAQQEFATNNLGVLSQIRGNNLTALQNVAKGITDNNQVIAPGSSIYNSVLGGVQYGSGGGSPAQILGQAQNLMQNDLATGQLHYTSDGQIDQNYYQSLAASQFSNPNGGQANQPSGSNTMGGEANQYNPTYQSAIASGLQPVIAGAVVKSSITGDQYISGAKLPSALQTQALASQGKTGIDFVPAENVPNIQQLDVALGQMKNLYDLAPQFLSSGILGRIKGLTTNQVQSYLQTDPGWANFNAVRLQAIDYLKGLAQGGGFRTNQSEIDAAANSLLSISDNLESAQAKMNQATKNIDLAYQTFLPSHKTTNLSTLGSSQSSSGGVGNSLYAL